MDSAVTKVVSVRDPAIDRTSMGDDAIAKYTSTRDYDLLKFLPDRQPMVFTLREIPQGLMIRFVLGEVQGLSEPGPKEWSRAFACAVRSVADIRQRDGTTLPGDQTLPMLGDQAMLADAAMERFDVRTILEIGAVALTHSFLACETDRIYPLPPMLLAI